MAKRPTKTELAALESAAEAALAASFKRQIIFWLIAAALLVAFLMVFRTILLPFAAGMILAYFLDPVADRLEAIGLSRVMATVAILTSFLVVFLIGLMIVVPMLVSQFGDFAGRIPDYIQRLQSLITSFDTSWLARFGIDHEHLQSNLNSLVTQGATFLTGLFSSIWSSGKALVDIIGLFVVTPVVAFYMLLDWDNMIERIDSWLPRQHAETIRELAREMDNAVAGFVRGQVSVCLLLGLFYAVSLVMLGLNFGLLIGIGAGLVSFIPFVGAALGFIASMSVALVQFWPDWHWIAAVAAVFAVGQFLEGNILQPKLVGSSVGLHPVWLMFALFAFGYLFGFVGMLVAVPAAAMVGVLARFALRQYLASALYKGTGVPEQSGASDE